MNSATRQIAHGVVLVVGLLLIVGGVVSGKPGAWIVGLLVAAVSIQQWCAWRRRRCPKAPATDGRGEEAPLQ